MIGARRTRRLTLTRDIKGRQLIPDCSTRHSSAHPSHRTLPNANDCGTSDAKPMAALPAYREEKFSSKVKHWLSAQRQQGRKREKFPLSDDGEATSSSFGGGAGGREAPISSSLFHPISWHRPGKRGGSEGKEVQIGDGGRGKRKFGTLKTTNGRPFLGRPSGKIPRSLPCAVRAAGCPPPKREEGGG